MLHLTNGDATVDLLRAADMAGTILPWRDVLHEGPVPAGLGLDALSAVRARFLAGLGWGAVETIRDAFARRHAALRRHLQQFPSVRNGLGRTEHHALLAVAAGIDKPASLFRAHLDHEESPFLGDWTFWRYLKKLAAGAHPLLHIDGLHDDARFAEATLTLTDDGRRVLTGDADAVHLNGIDCWLGGVHLTGSTARWRWDEKAGRLHGV